MTEATEQIGFNEDNIPTLKMINIETSFIFALENSSFNSGQ